MAWSAGPMSLGLLQPDMMPVRPPRKGDGMKRPCALRILLVALLDLVVVSATGAAYRHFIDRWEGSLRAPLIAASMAGMLFIIVAPSLVGSDRRPTDRDVR